MQDTDNFIAQRGDTLYKTESQNLMSTMQDTDLLLVSRDKENYKVEWSEIKDEFNGGGGLLPPVLSNVSLIESNPDADPRFTEQEFVASAQLSQEGDPVSSKTFDATVTGKITAKPVTDEITDIETETAPTYSDDLSSSGFSYPPELAFNGNLEDSARASAGPVTWDTSSYPLTGALTVYVRLKGEQSTTVTVTSPAGENVVTAAGTGADYLPIPATLPSISNISSVKVQRFRTTDGAELGAHLCGYELDGLLFVDDQVLTL